MVDGDVRNTFLVCCIASVIVLGVALPSAATSIALTDVPLGTHRFGHLSTPDAIVARVGADGVGWDNPPEGSANGPWSFDITADGSVFLLDQNNSRLLVWDPAEPGAPARTVPLPKDVIRVAADLAVGSGGTIYLTYLPQDPPDERKTLSVCALSPSGKLLWTAPTDIAYFNSRLRTAPDGSVYWEGAYDTRNPPSGWWTPVTSPDGRPLSLERQRAGVTRFQPMPGGHRFEQTDVGDEPTHQWRLTLMDRGRPAGMWRVTSDDDLGGTVGVPGMVGGDPIVMLEVARQTQDDFLYEYIALRIPSAGGKVTQLSLDPHAVWGDVPTTGLRVGPDGALYQLRSDIDTGVTIARYSLAAGTPTPSPTPNPTDPPTATSPGPTVTASPSGPPSTPTNETPTGAVPSSPAASSSAAGWVIGGSLVAVAAIGLGVMLALRLRARRSQAHTDGPPTTRDG